ncbi:MAG: hypothetical protein HN919_18905 [Verrucomicrobia bacterium]|jgi:ATP-dependent helicase/nuclease subunit B|nr:hypothetical protein [Verrucomicrobiota bacterium]MBT7068374.1 hypothetical protein [Verrucomicrobiota bacterium]MBT7701235.1 hypothetical protein [Verrucomicrobiota bacterium]
MPVTRHFLGWNRPLVEAVREFLIPAPPTQPVDLEADLIVAPTGQAGRRLTDALALYCGRADTVMLSCRVISPAVLLAEAAGPIPTASALDVQACWADVLCQHDLAALHGLFPSPPADVDVDWALHFSDTIEALRAELIKAGLSIADLVATRPDDLAELERWQDLAHLEAAYLEALRKANLQDPCLQQLAAADAPLVDSAIKRIIVAGVPDPTEPARRVLQKLADHIDIHILIAAPESHCDAFDDWGRPLCDAWSTHPIDFPDPNRQIVLATSPADQAETAIRLLQTEVTRDGQTAAIGAPDSRVIPHLQSALTRRGRCAFDPTDKSLREHPLFHLVEAYVTLAADQSYAALARLVRQPELLQHVAHHDPTTVTDLLQQLDDLQNTHIPWDLGAVRLWLRAADEQQALKQTIGWITDLLPGRDATLSGLVRAFLRAVLEHRTVTAGEPDDDEFERAALAIDEVLHELADVESRTTLPMRNAALLFLRRLTAQSYHRERAPEAIDLDGWLELAWNPASTLIVTGFTDDAVPGSAGDNAFLTNSLRQTLGMRSDADVLARDIFLLHILVESRRDTGALWLIAGKTSDSGDPLRPSRLLLRCPDAELPARARQLFREVKELRSRPAATIGFPLDPTPPPDLPPDRHVPTSISVTAFRDYLACPFRFYLRRVLRMEAQDDHKRAPDALDFGIMVHDALERMGQNPELRTTTDARLLTTFLTEQAATWVKRQYGTAPALPIRMALHAAQQRLEAAAHVQAALAAEGWEIIQAEQDFKCELGGLTLRGKIDRIDRHRDSGALRVIDYKTTDGSKKPTDTHLAAQGPDTPEFAQVSVAGKAKRWTDLQLPLYAAFGVEPSDTPPEPAYFNLPRAVTETALLPWPAFDGDLAASAFDCAEAITEQIRAGVFWPPAERVDYDDFESLFHDGIAGWEEIESRRSEVGGRGSEGG